jgi:hypothetical protein
VTVCVTGCNSSGFLFQVSAAALFCCLQTHPIFDGTSIHCTIVLAVTSYSYFPDLKSFAGITEPLATAAVCAVGGLASLALYIRRSYEGSVVGRGHTDDGSQPFVSAAEKANKILFVTLCLGIAAVLVGLLLRLPVVVIVLEVGGVMALAEFYQRRWAGGPAGVQWTGVLLIALGSCTAGLVAICFSKETLYFMDFSLYFHEEWTIQGFCEMFSLLVAIAVILPSLAYGAGSDATIKWFNANQEDGDYSLPGDSSFMLTLCSEVVYFNKSNCVVKQARTAQSLLKACSTCSTLLQILKHFVA